MEREGAARGERRWGCARVRGALCLRRVPSAYHGLVEQFLAEGNSVDSEDAVVDQDVRMGGARRAGEQLLREWRGPQRIAPNCARIAPELRGPCRQDLIVRIELHAEAHARVAPHHRRHLQREVVEVGESEEAMEETVAAVAVAARHLHGLPPAAVVAPRRRPPVGRARPRREQRLGPFEPPTRRLGAIIDVVSVHRAQVQP